jgi:hypothetical protein
VPIQRSAMALARGARTGVRRMRMASLANTASKTHAGERGVAVPDQERERSCAVAEVGHQIPCLLSHPRTGGVGGDAQQMDTADGVLHHKQHGEPVTQHRVDAEEVGGENGCGPGQPGTGASSARCGEVQGRRRLASGSTTPCPAQPGSHVAGVTIRCRRPAWDSSRVSATNTARSAQDSRGRWTWRRNTATSCRSTRISAFFDREPRASSPSQTTSRLAEYHHATRA